MQPARWKQTTLVLVELFAAVDAEAVVLVDPDAAWQFLDRYQQQAEARRSLTEG